MTRSLIIITAIIIVASSMFTDVFAGGGKRNGTAGVQELLIPVGARGLALSGSYTAGINGIDALYYNPAGLIQADNKVEAQFSHMNYIADIGISYAAVASNFDALGAFALSIKTVDFGKIPITTVENPQGDGSTFTPNYMTICLTYANFLTDRIRIGTTLKLVSEEIDRVSATAFCIDAGVQYINFAGVDGLELGVALKNFGAQSKFAGSGLLRAATESTANRGENYYALDAARFDMPSQFEIGLAYKSKLNEDLDGLVAGTFQDNIYSYDEAKVGAEVNFMKMFHARVGYSAVQETNTDDDVLFGATFGAGVTFDAELKIHVDYAYRHAKYFDANHLFTVSLGF